VKYATGKDDELTISSYCTIQRSTTLCLTIPEMAEDGKQEPEKT